MCENPEYLEKKRQYETVNFISHFKSNQNKLKGKECTLSLICNSTGDRWKKQHYNKEKEHNW